MTLTNNRLYRPAFKFFLNIVTWWWPA